MKKIFKITGAVLLAGAIFSGTAMAATSSTSILKGQDQMTGGLISEGDGSADLKGECTGGTQISIRAMKVINNWPDNNIAEIQGLNNKGEVTRTNIALGDGNYYVELNNDWQNDSSGKGSLTN